MTTTVPRIITPAVLIAAVLATTVSTAAAADGRLKREATKGYRAQAPDSASAARQNPDYDFFDVRIEGGHFVDVIDINNSRVAVGVYTDDGGAAHTFLWSNGQVIRVADHPGSFHTSVAAIDNRGRLFGNWGSDTEQIAGYYVLATGQWVALPPYQGYPLNFGYRVNDAGRAVGTSCTSGTFFNADGCVSWIWNGTSYEASTVPGSLVTALIGINDPGEAVGYWIDASFNGHGLLVGKSGALSELHVTDIYGNSVNFVSYDDDNRGAVLGVGLIDPNDYALSAILYKGKTTVLPKYPGVVRTFYQGLNERGDLTGLWFNDPFADFFGLIALKK